MYNEQYFEDYRDDDHEPVIYSGNLRHICEHLEVVLSELYGDTPVDLSLLENSLDEVANGLGLRLPRNALLIERKRRHDTSLCHFLPDTNNYQLA